MEQRTPQGTTRRTGRILRPAATALVESLGLCAPNAERPGHWQTADGFIAVNAGLIKEDFQDADDLLRVLVTIEPRDVQETTRSEIAKEFPDYKGMANDRRRSVWSRMLHISRLCRTRRVGELLNELLCLGVVIDRASVEVHRVSSSFCATVNMAILKNLLELYQNRSFLEIRRIDVERIARATTRTPG